MGQTIFIGISAGVASALLFGTLASGTLLSVPLFYLSPLPILLGALGWSHLAGLIAAVTAALLLGAFFTSTFFLAFLLGVGLPAWWIGYLSLLARPIGGAPGGLEWYPTGKLTIWIALVAGLVAVLLVFSIATDADELRNRLRRALEPMLTGGSRGRDSGAGTSGVVRNFLDAPELILPPALAVMTTLVGSLLLYLAGRIVRASGRLRRPWPELKAMRFPPSAPVAVALVLAGALLLSGVPQIVAAIFAAALLTASALLGLAVLHAITRNVNGRGMLLGSCYGAMFVFGWPVLLAAMLGLADMALDFRGRVRAPPSKPQ